MRILLSVVFAVWLVGCGTKKNPEACCVDEADCAAVGLPVGSTCEAGLSCRNNRCVEVSCAGSSDCDALAPYCEGEVCQQACSEDAQCPGFGQSTEEFCVAGACVECREASNDCNSATPVCDAGACRRCERNEECRSGACSANGSCVDEMSVAYVTPTGSSISSCSQLEPCSFARALEPGISRPYVVVSSGNYAFSGSRSLDGLRSIIGAKGTAPVFSSTAPGPIFTLSSGADITFDHVEIRGATNTASASGDGNGIDCPSNFQKSTLRVSRSVFTQCANAGIRARQCNADIRESTFIANARGIEMTDVMGSIERSTLALNTEFGLGLDGGLYAAANNFIYRNLRGTELYFSTAGSTFEFNTIVDNSMFGVSCDGSGTFAFSGNLIARNQLDAAAACNFNGSLIIQGDIGMLKFKNPSTPPYDYHLTAGSIAIDQIFGSTQVRDFDGESRPYGNGHDYGADELH